MKKLVLMIFLCFSMLLSVNAFAEGEDIVVKVNDEILESDVAPQLVNDRTMLPMRAIFEALGAKVTWFEEDELIFATKGEFMITLKIGVSEMSVQKISDDANIAVQLDTAPYIYNDRTMVPVRAIAESLNASVEWIDETQTVVITK